MAHRVRILVLLLLATPLLVPIAAAQKPPAPPPPPPPPPSTGTPNRPGIVPPPSSQPTQPVGELVMFLTGRVATDDGSPVPNNVQIERICNNRVRQQIYASLRGDFSMQLGSRADSIIDASGDTSLPSGVAARDPNMGIPQSELRNCELRASASGFHYGTVNLLELDTFGGSVNVGLIIMQRAVKMKGLTLSATPYKAPKDARKAFEKGLDAERNSRLANARKYFEQAVALYPNFLNAWFQLGTVLQQQNQDVAARAAYLRATAIDPKFRPPHLSLAQLAYQAGNWTEVLDHTAHILDLDPLNQAALAGYVLDLDPLNYSEAYFYDAVANYKLNRMKEAERSALKAERVDLRTQFPQLHLLLADFAARKRDYPTAISELQNYLDLAPHAKNVIQVREQLANLQKLNHPVSAGEKSDPM